MNLETALAKSICAVCCMLSVGLPAGAAFLFARRASGARKQPPGFTPPPSETSGPVPLEVPVEPSADPLRPFGAPDPSFPTSVDAPAARIATPLSPADPSYALPPLPPPSPAEIARQKRNRMWMWIGGAGSTALVVAFGAAVLAGIAFVLLCITVVIEMVSGINFSKGRLLRIDGKARSAPTVKASGWQTTVASAPERLGFVERRILSIAWQRSAELEHASVVAFGRLAERLVELGAAADLVERAHLAAIDEIRHARLSYALASTYAGKALGPGPFPALASGEARRKSSPRYVALASLAKASFVDGCLGEGLAAAVAQRASACVTDLGLRSMLSTIAEDEARHAELAWSVIEWCVIEGDDRVRSALEQAAGELDTTLTPSLPPIPGVSEPWLRDHGILPQCELGALHAETVAAIRARVRPLLAWPVARVSAQ